MNHSLEHLGDMHSTINQTPSLQCPIWTNADEKLIDQVEYWVGGIFICCLSIPGILMNLIAILALLLKSSNRTTFNSLLISLFTFDSIYLLFETIETFRRRFKLESRLHTILLPKLIYPLTIISLSASIFMTVAVAHERYDAIRKPIIHRQSMRSTKFMRKKFIIYILIVCCFAIGFNIPKFFEVDLVWVPDKPNGANESNRLTASGNESTKKEDLIPTIEITQMRRNPYYSMYYICLCRLIILGIVPFSLLTFFNCAIYNRIKKPMPLIEDTNLSTRIRRNQENDLAKVLFAIVGLCIICHTLRFFLNFYEMIWINNLIACSQAGGREFPVWSHVVQEFSRLLLILNSSTNIVIYCCFNAKFRNQLTKYKGTVIKKLTLKTESIEQVDPLTTKEEFLCDRVELEPIQENQGGECHSVAALQES